MDEREKNDYPEIEEIESPGGNQRLAASGESRRRFSKLGIGSAGVVLTLASRSGMANTLACDCPSRVMSKWHSGHSTKPTKCDGRPPSYWCSSSTSWPKGCDKTTTVGHVCGNGGSSAGQCSLYTVMKTQQSFDPDKVYMYAAATYLNIMSSKVTFMTVEKLQEIIYPFMSSGSYSPTAGTTWHGPELAAYLKKTFYTT